MSGYHALMRIFVEVFGWYGALALLLAYGLVSFSVIEPEGVGYQLLVITGCAGIVAVSMYRKTYQPVLLNAVSMLIGLAALAKAVF
jgi:hypothetical protein